MGSVPSVLASKLFKKQRDVVICKHLVLSQELGGGVVNVYMLDISKLAFVSLASWMCKAAYTI